MASFSDSSKQHAAPGAAAQAAADEWYDQGFDLNDETQIFDYAQSGINPDLIPSAEQKLEASEYNQVRSDAKESLQSGNLKLDITPVGQIASGETTHERGPRRGAIMVGGQGKIEDIPLSLDVAREHEGVYTDEYKAKARQKEAAAAAKAQAEAHESVYSDAYLEQKDHASSEPGSSGTDYAEGDYDEFATHVHHEGGLSEADLRFLQAQRIRESQNAEAQVVKPQPSHPRSSPNQAAPKVVAPRNSAAINERMRHQGPKVVAPRDSAAINERMGHTAPAVRSSHQERVERSQQLAQARRDEQQAARLRRQQQLQEQQERQAAQQAAQQAKTDAAAARLQRAQAHRAAQVEQAVRSARPDDNFLQHQAAAMLKEQERSLQKLSPLERQQAQSRSHNLAVLAQHKAQRAAEQAQRDKEHRDRLASSLYDQQERDQAQVKAANAAHHGSYQFEPVEEKKRSSALDALQAQGESLVPKARASSLDAIGSGAALMEQEPVDPDAPSSAFNAFQDGSFAADQALKEQERAHARAQYEAEVAARAGDLQARLAQIDVDKAQRAADKALEEQALADEFDAWAHEKGGAVNPHLIGPQPTRSLDDYANLTPVHQRTKSLDDFQDLRTREPLRARDPQHSIDDYQDLRTSGHQPTKSIYDFKDLRTAEHHRTKSLDDFADISGTTQSFSSHKEQKFFAAPQRKALPQGGIVATSGSKQAPNQAGGATIEEHDYGTYLYGSSIGDSALEQDANMQEYADTAHAFEVLERKGKRMAYGRKDARVANGITAAGGAGLSTGEGKASLEFTPKQKGSGGLGHSDYLGSAQRGAGVANPTQTKAGGSAPHQIQGSVSVQEQLTDMSTAGHRARGGQEKSLEELAREYPGLSMEHLVKLKRSSNRCHLVSRTPIFDAASNITMYELKFTAGKVFQVNALKSEHVYHVLFGYFIRRGISCFIGRNRHVLVMMPLTYDLVDYLERYSVSRVVLRICPEQPVTPSALHLLTQLRRNGMSFAIDLMLLIKKEWNKAILSIEYVMIDMSGKVNEQLNVFQRLKSKAPWLKTIGFNDTKGDGYAYLAKRMIDFLDGPLWSPKIVLNQDLKSFAPAQNEVLTLIRELFKDQPNYTIFQRFLMGHEAMARDMAVFLYRFRHASPRQVQNISELYNFLLEYSANRCFSVMAARAIMLTYIKAANHSSQSILQEHYIQALVRGYFCEYISKVFNDPFVERFGFQSGMFSLLHMFLLKEEVDVIADDAYNDIFDRIYGDSELMADIIECVQAIEATDLGAIFTFIQKYQVPPASVLISYEKALMRTNELLLVLNIITTRK